MTICLFSVKSCINVLRLGGRFNDAKPLLAAAAVNLVGT